MIGAYNYIEKPERLGLVNHLFVLYVHGHAQNEADLQELDYKNLDDILIIAVELLQDINVYDQSVFNPFSFMQLSLLEFGLIKNPQNKTFYAW